MNIYKEIYNEFIWDRKNPLKNYNEDVKGFENEKYLILVEDINESYKKLKIFRKTITFSKIKKDAYQDYGFVNIYHESVMIAFWRTFNIFYKFIKRMNYFLNDVEKAKKKIRSNNVKKLHDAKYIISERDINKFNLNLNCDEFDYVTIDNTKNLHFIDKEKVYILDEETAAMLLLEIK